MNRKKTILLVIVVAVILIAGILIYRAIRTPQKNTTLTNAQQQNLIADKITFMQRNASGATKQDHNWSLETYGPSVDALYWRDQAISALRAEGFAITIR